MIHRAPPPVPRRGVLMRPVPTRPAIAAKLVADPGARLHLGCGPKRIPGWLNTDGVPGVGEALVDLHALDLPESTFAVIYGSHVLEHCWPAETPRILEQLLEALQPGGTLLLSVPDLRLVVQNCVDSNVYGGEDSALSVIYGGAFSRATSAPDLHRQAFWRERLERLLLDAGFTNVREWGFGKYAEIDALADYSTYPRANGKSTISLNLEADRPGKVVAAAPVEPLDVSVILGTVDRPKMLRDCIEAVRASCAGLRYEIVVAYGRANEPSLPWMGEQRDIVPVLGGMEGAIPAFNRAYDACRGRYICQINDDVLVDGDAIARAVRHLDAEVASAGVVFKFDRLDGAGYRHENLGGKLHPNQIVARRSTCESVVERIGAFWGDAAHRTDKTYGGDSAFGAFCHHLGLRLDSVDGVTCRDRCNESQDALREANARIAPDHLQRFNATYRPLLDAPAIAPAADEWPRLYVPRMGMAPRRSPVEAGHPLRLLHLSLRDATEPQVDLRRALARIGPTVEMPWHGHEREAIEIARSRPDLIFAQIQSDAWTPAMSAALRAAAGTACMLVLWTGDVRTSGAQPVERWLVSAAQHFDLLLADSTTYPRKLALDERVPASCGYLGCGIDPSLNPWNAAATEAGAAVFLGTNYRSLDGGAREQLMFDVSAALPGSLTIYGRGWGGTRLESIALPFVEQPMASAIMRRAPVTICTSLFSDLGRYTSDRLKRALASGAVVAVRRFPDMEGLGLVDGENCLTWSTQAELVALLRDWTRPERAADRQVIRARAAELAHRRFTWDRVVEELLAIVRDHRERRGLV
jgi:SAM-dependent methyltransferase